MAANRPPASLPPAFMPLWSVLRHEDERLGSRRTLARRLGISTHTIQRILVDGDVPALSGSRNLRLVRSWTRIVVAIATYAGEDPAEWVRGVGIDWDEETAAFVDTLVSGPPARRGRRRREGREVGRASGPLRIRIGVHPSHPGGTGDGPAILGVELVRRALESARPDVAVAWELTDGDPAWFEPTGSGVPPDLVVGVPGDVVTERRESTAVTIPGWRAPLEALAVEGTTGELPRDWDGVMGSGASAPIVVGTGDAAEDILRIHHRVPSDRIRRGAIDGGVGLAATVLDAREAADGGLVVVARRAVVSRTHAELKARGVATALIPEAADELPARPLVVTWPPGDRMAEVGEILIRDLPALPGSAPGATARLYAGALVSGAEDGWRLEDVPSARIGFRRALCRHLFRELVDRARADHAPGATAPVIVAMERAIGLLPVSWMDVLADVTGVVPTRGTGGLTLAPARHCQSCSATLSAELNRGSSDRYCRFCSDEHGALRPRSQVLDVLTRWIEEWQGVPPDDARRRADLLMRAMPAWGPSR